MKMKRMKLRVNHRQLLFLSREETSGNFQREGTLRVGRQERGSAQFCSCPRLFSFILFGSVVFGSPLLCVLLTLVFCRSPLFYFIQLLCFLLHLFTVFLSLSVHFSSPLFFSFQFSLSLSPQYPLLFSALLFCPVLIGSLILSSILLLSVLHGSFCVLHSPSCSFLFSCISFCVFCCPVLMFVLFFSFFLSFLLSSILFCVHFFPILLCSPLFPAVPLFFSLPSLSVALLHGSSAALIPSPSPSISVPLTHSDFTSWNVCVSDRRTASNRT